MLFSQPVKLLVLPILILNVLFVNEVQAQSILLISSGTKVYDNVGDDKVVKLNVKEDTWVNYKGRYGNYFKISNFFGKDRTYPGGVFDGFVSITSVLDTAAREEYDDLLSSGILITTSDTESDVQNSAKTTPPKIQARPNINYDVDKFYLGMAKAEAIALNKSLIQIGKSTYNIALTFNQNSTLTEMAISGDSKDALAVEGFIKQQTEELLEAVKDQFGKSQKSSVYPSFLEIVENKIYSIAEWSLPAKTIVIGVGEKDDLYYSSLIIKQ